MREGQIHQDFALAEVASNIKCMFGYVTHLISGVCVWVFSLGKAAGFYSRMESVSQHPVTEVTGHEMKNSFNMVM